MSVLWQDIQIKFFILFFNHEEKKHCSSLDKSISELRNMKTKLFFKKLLSCSSRQPLFVPDPYMIFSVLQRYVKVVYTGMSFSIAQSLNMKQNNCKFIAAESHSEESGRSTASKPLSARARNDSNSSSDFQAESARRKRRKDRKHSSHLQRIQAHSSSQPHFHSSSKTNRLLSVHSAFTRQVKTKWWIVPRSFYYVYFLLCFILFGNRGCFSRHKLNSLISVVLSWKLKKKKSRSPHTVIPSADVVLRG